MIKASARKRGKTTREGAETPIMRPGQGHNGAVRGHDQRIGAKTDAWRRETRPSGDHEATAGW
jgi:hypothetical protein